MTKEYFVAYERGLWLLDQVHMQHANAPSHKIVVVDQRSATNTTFTQILRYTAVRGGSKRRYVTKVGEEWPRDTTGCPNSTMQGVGARRILVLSLWPLLRIQFLGLGCSSFFLFLVVVQSWPPEKHCIPSKTFRIRQVVASCGWPGRAKSRKHHSQHWRQQHSR